MEGEIQDYIKAWVQVTLSL
ncbi:uncharacterized protein G2W53_021413 [Senna tora]|uniref:Uncharacterized protein n=1 Tax=Senna tora TaxID=362788 RepID=A0A834TLD2_9FABA|nr:uncharacterized protein G2W53_021413 [Senna tora]